jgi:citrate lyase subunit beta/citryl-CoA lyase
MGALISPVAAPGKQGMKDASLLRSLMFVPGNNRRFIDNAPSTGADAICLDLEDSVAPADKAAGRQTVRESLAAVAAAGEYQVFVRVNGLDTGLLEEDLLAVIGPEIDGISLPKANSPEIVQTVDHYLTVLEVKQGLKKGSIRIAPWIESAEAVLRAADICRASDRVVAASFGSEDFTIDMRIQRSRSSKEVEWARYAFATACAAAGVAAFDAPEMDYRDTAQLEQDATFVRSIGFTGKFCIHPSQVAIVNRIFQPTALEIEEARKIVEVYQQAERESRGAVGMDGMVVDRPVYVRALALLERAAANEQAGKDT